MKREEITNFKLPVLDIKEDEKDHPDNLLVHPFRSMWVAPSNGGKTFSIIGMLKKFYSKYFDRIYLVSPNAKVGKTNPWEMLKLDDDRVHTDYKGIDDVITEVKDLQEADDPPRKKKILLILDDCAGHLNNNRNGQMSDFIIQCRHYNVSVILTTQKLRLIPQVIRTNCDHYCVFNITNGEEKKTFLSENGDAHNMEEIFNEAVKDDGQVSRPFLHLNKRKNRFFKRFDTELVTEDENSSE